MMDVLLIRLEGPLMSFGATSVDQIGPTLEYPGRSLLTGLFANALGWSHGDFGRLDRLQERLLYAARQDRHGQKLQDFQTVLLGSEHLREGWTTRGFAESREGGSSKATHIRYRHYIADAAYTVAVVLDSPEESPTLLDLAQAMQRPERPLFIGRKPCLPSAPMFLGMRETEDLLAALKEEPVAQGPQPLAGRRVSRSGLYPVWHEVDTERADGGALALPVCVERDWANQIHVGRRFVRQLQLRVEEVTDERA